MNEDLLALARDWKYGVVRVVHPSVGRRLNHALVVAGNEDPVPFGTATDETCPSLEDILRRECSRPRLR